MREQERKKEREPGPKPDQGQGEDQGKDQALSYSYSQSERKKREGRRDSSIWDGCGLDRREGPHASREPAARTAVQEGCYVQGRLSVWCSAVSAPPRVRMYVYAWNLLHNQQCANHSLPMEWLRGGRQARGVLALATGRLDPK